MTARWCVRCEDFSTPPVKTRAEAERVLAAIEKFGACRYTHEVVEYAPTGRAAPAYGRSSPEADAQGYELTGIRLRYPEEAT